MGWLTRWQDRQRELAAGVDADLVEANRKRWKLSFCLSVRFRPSFNWLTMACFVAGLLLAEWAGAESGFLNSSSRPEPPSIWKFRSRR